MQMTAQHFHGQFRIGIMFSDVFPRLFDGLPHRIVTFPVHRFVHTACHKNNSVGKFLLIADPFKDNLIPCFTAR